jgi:16S rRNA (cytosine1402-N4)-methyltransferase
MGDTSDEQIWIGRTTTEATGQSADMPTNEESYHIPVMLQECCDWLAIKPNGVYVDGTLGGGGHTAEILRRLYAGATDSSTGKVLSFDEDTNALRNAERRFSDELRKGSQSKLELRNENFRMACSIEEATPLSGLLLDLGVSSRQLDSSSIGLSYRVNSRLDMRFGSHGKQSAEAFIAEAGERELEYILREYGEEPFSRPIARRILEHRRATPITTTFDLRAIVEQTVPPHLRFKALSRVFQALRIYVNRELEILQETLTNIVPKLAPGGRIVVLSYHSLEDRIVKHVFKELAKDRVPDLTNPKSTTRTIVPQIRILTKHPLEPSAEEIERNPRARSAKLRVAEKV